MKHFILDMDGTITESRQIISPDMMRALGSLQCENIVVVSGADKKQIKKQLGNFKPRHILAQSGNDSPFWKVKLTKKEKQEVVEHIKKIKRFFPHYFEKGESDLLQDRGSQMAFSFIGHNADTNKKRDFDCKGVLRGAILKTIPLNSNKLEVRVAGTTCLDYTKKNKNKGKNIEKLIRHLNWNKEDCIYFGDALSPGRNDETVIGVIKTVEVKDPADLIVKLKPYSV